MPSKFKNNLFFFNNNNFTFTLSEKENIFPGFLICQSKSILNNINSKKNTVNNISKLVAKKKEIKENLRKKPFRYNEGNIIKKLEELGIGRPSTYNSFCQIILKRKYVFLDEKKNFVPTKLGFLVNKWLQNNFSLLINEKYTASLESELDKISNGNETYFCFINNF